jgi:phosphoribosyl 1,2-cyclic phosphodiesterase
MRLHLLGVRGSTPAPGPSFVRYGGHTSCVAIAADGEPYPTLVLDAGTGLRHLGHLLGTAPFRGTLLLTHLHWDHVQGLPFTPCIDRTDADVDLRLPAQGRRSARALLDRFMSPPSFPIRATGLRGTWRTRTLRPGVTRVGAFAVTAAEVPHKGGRTFGYRITADGATVTYIPDHALAGAPSANARMLAEGTDILLHDAANPVGQRDSATRFGHSTVDDAIAFAEAAGAGRLLLTHHAPTRTDDELDVLAATLDPTGLYVALAREGIAIQTGPSPGPGEKDSNDHAERVGSYGEFSRSVTR